MKKHEYKYGQLRKLLVILGLLAMQVISNFWFV